MLARIPSAWELLIVNDGSTDGTGAILEHLADEFAQLTVVTHQANRGLGSALITGFNTAQGDVIVTMDADLSHPVELALELVERCGEFDAVYASRFIPGGAMVGVPSWRQAISRTANYVARYLYNSPTRDLTTGYRAYRTHVVRSLHLTGTGFEIQLEITVRLLVAGRSISEIPMTLLGREAGKSKMRYLRLIRPYTATALSLARLRWCR